MKIQSRDAKRAMVKIFGNKVTVRTQTEVINGGRYYGEPVINVWSSRKEQLDRIDEVLAAGFNVAMVILRNGEKGYPHYTWNYGRPGKLETIDLRTVES